ncbi:MAG: branched-chain amino acid ABC transporter permease [Desulfobacteraceae bacterium]|nr:MAG: branched-chain amino acid ABC transporter permease [Desulfobacteraceae bacterium]
MRSKTFRESYKEDIRLFQTIWIKVWMGLFIVFLSLLPFLGDPYVVYLVNISSVAAISALGLNILTGFTGQISLGHAAFFAIGAYGTAILASRFSLPFWVSLPAGGIVATVAGLLVGVPCLRLKGLYLAMATMSFGVVIEFLVVTLDGLTKGVRGIAVPPVKLFGYALDSNETLYYLLLSVTALCLITASNIIRTRVGRAFVAIRDRDIAAEVMGVDLVTYKVMAFAISSFYAGIAGGLYAYLMAYIHPEHFSFLLSVQYLAMIIVGGLGSILGSVFGAVFITIVPEFIKSFAEGLSRIFPVLEGRYDDNWNIAAFGLMIVLFLIFEPKGLAGIWGRVKTCFKNWPYTY